MKAVFVFGAFSFGGAERVICNLANYFSDMGDEITLVTFHSREICYKLNKNIKILNGIGPKNKLLKIIELRKYLKKNKPDIVLSFLTQINIAAIIATIGTNIPLVISERNDPKSSPSNIVMRFMRQILYPLASGCVFQTKEAQEYYKQKIKDRSEIIPNPVDIKIKPNSFESRENKIILAGRMTEQKNQELAINAFLDLHHKFPEYTMHIYGDGPLRENIHELVIKNHMQERVFLEGQSNNLYDKLNESSIFILSSNYEGMPNVVMEAMALGNVVISTDCPCGGPKFLIQDRKNGFLFPVGDKDKLVEILNEVLNNKKLQFEVSNNAIKITEELNPEKVFKKWEKYLYKIYKACR